ncbi:hypothetical protein GCM10022286_14830 [Gryllotalpicola daejeonensis]|uniref:DUF3040 domain-containing protein n=2 Tax=Gryllotalpicola daejeonensis TaxID=993087 RepID=A0ABP7ZJ89_9MICO
MSSVVRDAQCDGGVLAAVERLKDAAGKFHGLMELVCQSESFRGVKGVLSQCVSGHLECMNILLIIVAVIAVILLLTGGFVAAAHWLLWVGIVLALFAIIVWIVRAIGGRNRV